MSEEVAKTQSKRERAFLWRFEAQPSWRGSGKTFSTLPTDPA